MIIATRSIWPTSKGLVLPVSFSFFYRMWLAVNTFIPVYIPDIYSCFRGIATIKAKVAAMVKIFKNPD